MRYYHTENQCFEVFLATVQKMHCTAWASSITLQVHLCKLRFKCDEPRLNPHLIKIAAAATESRVAEQTALCVTGSWRAKGGNDSKSPLKQIFC